MLVLHRSVYVDLNDEVPEQKGLSCSGNTPEVSGSDPEASNTCRAEARFRACSIQSRCCSVVDIDLEVWVDMISIGLNPHRQLVFFTH